MDSLKRYNFIDEQGHPLEKCQDYIDLLHRAETAESSLAAMRKRADALEEHAYLLQEKYDAAITRAERAEACLRDAVSKLNQVKEYLEDYFEGDRDHRYIGIQCVIEIGVKRITNTLADVVLSSPPADASKMGGEREPAPYIPEPWGGPEGEE